MRANLERLVASRPTADASVRTPLVVPRLTRRDAVYGELESWYDRHLLACGWAVLDPLEPSIDGERITPLPLPRAAAARLRAHTAVVHADGRVTDAEGRP